MRGLLASFLQLCLASFVVGVTGEFRVAVFWNCLEECCCDMYITFLICYPVVMLRQWISNNGGELRYLALNLKEKACHIFQVIF